MIVAAGNKELAEKLVAIMKETKEEGKKQENGGHVSKLSRIL